MRPIKLTITAFGPFADSETIDFRDAIASGLFGIYGSTGSGKSTIFSAMTFALFGEAVRHEQDIGTLRSDHAARDVLTTVKFIFEIGEKRYLIRRQPDQVRPAKRGDGETKETHKAWLFDVTGIDIDDITPENTGKKIAEKKIGLVKNAIKELLGYGVEQFKQIVLLPQGKFEIFLTSNTDARRKILRDLFDVSLYRKLTENLIGQAKDAEKSVRQDREVCAARLTQENFESPDALMTGITEAKTLIEAAEKEVMLVSTAVKEKRLLLKKGEQLNEKFTDHEQAKSGFAAIQEKAEIHACNKLRLENARKAQSLLDVDRVLSTNLTQLREAQNVAEQKISDKEITQKAAELASSNLKHEETKADERNKLQRHIDDLNRHAKTLDDADSKLETWKKTENTLSKAQACFSAAEKTNNDLQTQLSHTRIKVKTAQENTLKNVKLKTDLNIAEQIKKTVEFYVTAQTRCTDASSNAATAKASHIVILSQLKQAHHNYDIAEADLAAAQAQHLAEKLENGHPCAVCGSKSHPNPATGSVASAGLDQIFREVRAELTELRVKDTEAAKTLAGAVSILEERQERLDKLTPPSDTLEETERKIAKLNADISQLAPDIKQDEFDAQVLDIEEKLNVSAEVLKTCRGSYDIAKIDLALAKQSYTVALETIPEKLHSKTSLKAEIKTRKDEHNALCAALKSAGEQEKLTREDAIRATKELESAQKATDTAKAHYDNAQKEFKSRLSQQGFSHEQYGKHKPDIIHIETIKQEVETYTQSFAIAQDKVKTSKEAIFDKQRPDLDTLKSQVINKETILNEKTQIVADLKSEHAKLSNLLKSISKELARIEALEKDTSVLRELAALFNANNPAKLDLETFAIGAMFDQVLQAANLRLKPMTNGQYSMEREIDGGKGAAKRGLGIYVLDTHTGKPRPTSTLSGGETFIHALALALGLSDIVESVSGKIRLDTIFIDEGFGSLDTDNDAGTLDQVLQTLQDLVSDNRAIGLISHVPLVQQAIPNGFTIIKTPSGSHIKTREC